MYRSYLSLMPEEEESTKTQEIHKERLKILAHFQTLTGQQQSEQRETWSEELEIVENEIAELKIKLGVQLNKRNHLRLLLGLDLIKKSVHNLAKEMREFINK